MIKVGVVGLGRGRAFASSAAAAGLELTVVCDSAAERLEAFGAASAVATTSSFDELLASDVEAVVLANAFHEHAPLAIRALDAGKHVLSETTACWGAAEGEALIEAVERSGRIYQLGENYPYLWHNLELRRLVAAGELGRIVYAEAEYVHPIPPELWRTLAPTAEHWRSWIPLIHYCTHTLGPIMHITGRMPVAVHGFAVRFDPDDPQMAGTARSADPAGVMLVELDDGTQVKLLHGTMEGGAVGTRLHGQVGAAESLRRGAGVWVRRGEHERVIEPPPAGPDDAGHGGADARTLAAFADAIRTGVQPFFDVHRGVAMSLAGTLAAESADEGGTRKAIPTF